MNLKTLKASITGGVFFFSCWVSCVNATLITTPVGLVPGDKYRLVFVSSESRDATSTNIEDYNLFITNLANQVPELAALGASWYAVASTESVNAIDNTHTSLIDTDTSVFLTNGNLFATSSDDFWNGVSMAEYLNINEFGTVISFGNVWTGTRHFNGLNEGDQSLGGLSSAGATAGLNSYLDPGWRREFTMSTTTELPLYGISSVLTVTQVSTIPEPATLTIFALTLVGLASRRFKK